MKLSNLTARAIFFVAFISTLIAFLISIIFQYKIFKDETKLIKNDYIEFKKNEIKNEVNKVFNTISAKETIINNQIKDKLKDRVNIAYSIANTIYEKNKAIMSENQIKDIILTTLKDIHYQEKNSYYFINRNDGKAILFNKISKLHENINILNKKDLSGKYFVREQIKIAKEKEEGFLETYFVKPNSTNKKEYKKITYVKNIKAFDWHIGTGEYIDDMQEHIKDNILKDISTVRFGKNGYIFVNRLDKKALVFDGVKLPHAKDYPNDELYKEQLNAIKNKEGGYFFYKFKKLNTLKEYKKLAFVKKYEKWDWIIGTGVYIDQIDQDIIEREKKYTKNILNQISTIVFSFLILLFMIYYISRKMSLHLDKNISNLIKSFKLASKNYKKMDTDKLTYLEFKILGKSLNKILLSRNETEMKLQRYIKIVNENVIISSTDEKGYITSVSEAFCKISGYKESELLGQNHNVVKHHKMNSGIFKDMWIDIQNGNTWYGEIRNKNKIGGTYWVETFIQPEFENEKIIGYTAISQDISDKKRVEFLSITDELTKLNNRRFFNQVIENEISRSIRGDLYLSFMMMDIDYFKNYNDTYGHKAGDEALQEFAKVLKSHSNRISDCAFRLGGEEFGLVFTAEDEEKSLRFAELLRKDVEKLRIEHKTSKVADYLTVSIGLVVRKGKNIHDSANLYKLADEALYKAKNEGRNTVRTN
ncbi:cache domain-containing protein [Poseidonibacter lekithochrous]|uniref:cache domain-containing protein n=1 Tax=Poseidonibacter lekithochrous TaxID=1904463 RepID=UPI0008FCBB0F|nr:cache domain-containing protein [Poseidonibacter lekithochrous]QKJ21982.1 multi-sensor domain-containing diguanylate cyclase [Poseidonibacter lekithochrous]